MEQTNPSKKVSTGAHPELKGNPVSLKMVQNPFQPFLPFLFGDNDGVGWNYFSGGAGLITTYDY
jgi:hypothetical protein